LRGPGFLQALMDERLEGVEVVFSKQYILLEPLLPLRRLAHKVNRDSGQRKFFLIAAAVRNHKARSHGETNEFGIAHARL